MKYIIAGLGNPGAEYTNSRHNVGWQVVEAFADVHADDAFSPSKKVKGESAKGKIGKHAVELVLPHTFMNKSGTAIAPLLSNAKAAERLVVVYDDIDLPLGTMRLAFGRGSGGHKGVESVVRSLKTKNFVRLRVGIAPSTPAGKIKKPKGEKAVVDFVLGGFTKKEQEALKGVKKTAVAALTAFVEKGRVAAMNEFN